MTKQAERLISKGVGYYLGTGLEWGSDSWANLKGYIMDVLYKDYPSLNDADRSDVAEDILKDLAQHLQVTANRYVVDAINAKTTKYRYGI